MYVASLKAFFCSFFSRFSFLRFPDIRNVLLVSVIYDSLFVVAYVNIIIIDVVKSSLVISLIFAIKKVLRMFLDIPFGILVDKKIGVKNSVLISIALRALFVICLLQQTTFWVIISAFFEGLSLAFFRGKISVLQYNVMAKHFLSEVFVEFNALYNFSIYSLTAIFSFIADWMYRISGISLICISSAVVLSLLLLVACTIPDLRTTTVNSDEKKSFGVVSSIKLLRQSGGLSIIGWCIVLGLCSLAWQLNATNQLLTLMLTDNVQMSTTVFKFGVMSMFFGSIISVFASNLSLFILSVVFIFILMLNAILPFFIPLKYDFYLILPYFLLCSTFENLLRARILDLSDRRIQCFAISISTTVTSVAAMIATHLFLFIGSFSNYIIAQSVTFALVVLISMAGFAIILFCRPVDKNV